MAQPTTHQTARLKRDLAAMSGMPAEQIEVQWHPDFWYAFFGDNELAALRVAYRYRLSPNVHCGPRPGFGDWYVRVGHRGFSNASTGGEG